TANAGRSGRPASTCRLPFTTRASPSTWCWPRPTAPDCSRRQDCTDQDSTDQDCIDRGCIDLRGSVMSEAVVDDIVAVLPPLLQSLEALGFVARHLNPPDFGRVMEAAGAPDQALQAARSRLNAWPEEFSQIRTLLE